MQNSLKNRKDQTYNFIERGIWTLLEANLGIVSACLPVLKPALGTLFPHLFGTLEGRTTKPYPHHHVTIGGSSHPSGHRSAGSTHNQSNPRYWSGPQKNEINVPVSASRPGRGSDEHHIIRGSDKDSSDAIELDDRASSPVRGQIFKAVEVTRTSFHESWPLGEQDGRWRQ